MRRARPLQTEGSGVGILRYDPMNETFLFLSVLGEVGETEQTRRIC